ncbi:MAG: HTH domain-containing protein [Prevotellaceae bacterium]|nr:HTH domain-containing protein [Prevotellaceae bacterium]
MNNEIFAKHSWYFRNALVRANYEDLSRGIHKTNVFLVRFLENALLGETNELKNRTMHIRFKEEDLQVHRNTGATVRVNDPVKTKNDPVNNILSLISKNKNITYDQLAEQTGVSRATIKRHIQKLKKAQILIRIGADKNGSWKIIAPK